MAIKIKAVTDELTSISGVLGMLSQQFLDEVKKMYDSLESLNANWKGKGSDQYYVSINNRKPDVEALGKIIGQYSDFINKAARIYETTDNDIASSATKL